MFQWFRHIASSPEQSEQQEGLLQRVVGAIMRPWEKVKHLGKALVGGTIYYYGNRIFWGGETSRYLYKRYRTIFQRMGFVRQAILAYKHRITAEIPKVLSTSKQVMGILDHRLKQIGLWDQHYADITQDLLEFGDSFYEIVFSKPDNRVIALKRLEPDYMYIQRDPYGRVILYVSVIDGIPVTIEPYRMLHFKMDAQPGDAFGVGLIEGGMDDLAALRILEDLNIQLVKHNIYPHRVYICPSDEVVGQVEQKLSDMKRFGDLVVPMNVKVQQMTSGTGVDLRGFMLYYQQKFFLDTGVPMDMLIKGTGANRATASEMSSAFNGNARAIQRNILAKLEWFCELVLATEGIVAPVRLVAPEIDKALEIARRQEIRQMYQEGLMCRDFAQELLDLKHPLNVIKTPEDLNSRLNVERNWLEQFKTGLLTRPYAIKLLGHDVPENRPAQPQAPQFAMPMPGAPGGQMPAPNGVPMGQPDEPDLIDPKHVEIVQPPVQAQTPQGGAEAGGEPAAGATPTAEVPSGTANKTMRAPIRVATVGLQTISTNELEAEKMAKGQVQTIYVRRLGQDGKIEDVPYAPFDSKKMVDRGHTQMDKRRGGESLGATAANPTYKVGQSTTPITEKASRITAKSPTVGKAKRDKADPTSAEEAYKVPSSEAPASSLQDNEEMIDGDNSGIQTEPTQVPTGEGAPMPPAEPPLPAGAPAGAGASMPPAGAPGGAPAPEGAPAGAPGGAPQPPQAPQIPGYFNPAASGGKTPKFADVFGDNEYSIRRPQKHVERVKEELIDAFGQKHRRIHERLREMHRPIDPNQSEFIRRKRAAAEQRHMMKNSKSGKDNLELVAIDVPVNREAQSWVKGTEGTLLAAMNVLNDRVISAVKQYARQSVKGTFALEDIQPLSNLITQEILSMHEHTTRLLETALQNVYVAGLNYTNELFASNVQAANTSVSLSAFGETFAERCTFYLGMETTKLVANLESKAIEVTSFVFALSKIIDVASERGRNLCASSAMMFFRDAVKLVMTDAVVSRDIADVEFLTTDDNVCHACKAHNMHHADVTKFSFENCSICNTVYRAHIVAE